MKFELERNSLRIEGAVTLQELDSLHRTVFDFGPENLHLIDLRNVTDIDYGGCQWLYFLRLSYPWLNWLWPDGQELKWLWRAFEN